MFSKLSLENSRVLNLGDAGVPSLLGNVLIDGRSLTILGTHPFPLFRVDYWLLRNQQLRAVSEFIHEFESPILLVGDLNLTPWSHHYPLHIEFALREP